MRAIFVSLYDSYCVCSHTHKFESNWHPSREKFNVLFDPDPFINGEKRNS